MRARFRRYRQGPTFVFNEATGEVCDAACRSRAAVDRVHIDILLFR
ncbi:MULTISPECIES: hypothetical protein [Nonomuraea]|uniref:Uncharacterized protein n=1 Tax=Nonomuraea mangrovi TaxID=2316207 RepID=A0ABW4SNC1_9ACTN